MALVVFEVVVGEQHLGDVQAVLREKLLVNRHEPRLADGGAGLELGELAGPLLVAEHAHASGCFRLSVSTPVPTFTTMREMFVSNSRRTPGG